MNEWVVKLPGAGTVKIERMPMQHAIGPKIDDFISSEGTGFLRPSALRAVTQPTIR